MAVKLRCVIKWEAIQADLFNIGVKGLSVSQIQGSGAFFLTNITNIILSILSASLVLDGSITLGMMMSLSYILGQLKGPVGAFIGFVHSYQDAKISLERLGEVHLHKDEDIDGEVTDGMYNGYNEDIVLNNVTYSYMGPNVQPVLKDVSFVIEGGKTTAIVGESGSGKTTLLKLLLNYFNPIEGDISIGKVKMNNIDKRKWRSLCSTVMQNGYIFSGTVAENIALSGDIIDKNRLRRAAVIANIHDFIMDMPSGYNTKIGPEGSGVSQGQRQRMLIVRAIYKNSMYIFCMRQLIH
jgi:ABC-type bacteriocin/lantibiotic exporters, contain an N-terminal double-glycine peptidase domain